MKETKDFYFNPLNKTKWGQDERSASDFAIAFLLASLLLWNVIVFSLVCMYREPNLLSESFMLLSLCLKMTRYRDIHLDFFLCRYLRTFAQNGRRDAFQKSF